MGMMDDLEGMFPDRLLVTSGNYDAYGEYIASGSQSIPCYIEGSQRTLRSPNGEETASTLQAFLDGAYDLTVDLHRYTLPARFSPDTNMVALSVEKISDETGPIAEVVYFP